MSVKLTKSRPRHWLQRVECYREQNGRTNHRTIASLGHFEKIDQHFESLVRRLEQATGWLQNPRPRSSRHGRNGGCPGSRRNGEKGAGEPVAEAEASAVAPFGGDWRVGATADRRCPNRA